MREAAASRSVIASTWSPSATVRRNVSSASRVSNGVGSACSQHSTLHEPGRPQTLRGALGRREHLAGERVRAEVLERPDHRGEVPGAAALGGERALRVGAPPRGARTARRGRGSSGTSRSTGRRPRVRPAGAGRIRSALTNRIRSPNRAAALAPVSSIDVEPSSATTRPPGRRSARSSVTRPEPHPASRTVSSPSSSSRRRRPHPSGTGGRRSGRRSGRPSRAARSGRLRPQEATSPGARRARSVEGHRRLPQRAEASEGPRSEGRSWPSRTFAPPHRGLPPVGVQPE